MCVLARLNLSQFFYGKTFSTEITFTFCYEKNFREKSELPELILLVKIGWLIFSVEIRTGVFSCLAASSLNFVLVERLSFDVPSLNMLCNLAYPCQQTSLIMVQLNFQSRVLRSDSMTDKLTVLNI